MMTFSHIAIVGAGALGGFFGCKLVRAGQRVSFLLRSDFSTVSTHGWTIRTPSGTAVHIPADRFQSIADPSCAPPADLLLVGLKTTANNHLESLIRPLVHDHSTILTLQNGLGNEDLLARLFGPSRVIGGITHLAATRAAPGVIDHLSGGEIRIGELDSPPTPRTRAVAGLFQAAGVPCQLLDNLPQGKWEKLVWNIPFNGLGAALDLTTDRLLASPDGEALLRALMGEVIAGARGLGLSLPDSLIDWNIARTRPIGPYRTSMQVDRQLRRPMEIEAIIGEPVRRAAAAGVAVPRMTALHDMLRALDAAR